jgi:hypothetical protein
VTQVTKVATEPHPIGVAPGVALATLALTPLLVFAAAAVVAAVTGVGTYFLLSAGQDGGEGFEALGWALLGAIVAVIVGLTVVVVGLIVLARRLFLPGHRVAPVVLALVGPFVPLVLGGGLTALFGYVPGVLGIPLTLAALAAPSLAFLWCDSAAPSQRTLLRGGAVLAAVIVVGSLVLYVMKDAREDKAIEALPLVLFDGTTAESPYPNWKRDAFTRTAVRQETAFAPEGHEAYLKYFSAPGVVFITMRSDVGECSPTLVRGYTCQVVGTLPAGVLRSYRSPAQYATYPESREFLVLVYADGSGVSVNVDATQQPAQDVLARLQRVDRKAFEGAAGKLSMN